MTLVEAGLLAQAALTCLAVAAAVMVVPRFRARVAGAAVAGIGVAGAVTGAAALAGGRGAVTLPVSLPFDPVVLAPDRLGGFFMVVAGLVGAVAAVYGIGYVQGAAASRTAMVGVRGLPAGAAAGARRR